MHGLFLGSGFVSAYWWFQGSRTNGATCLEATFLGSLMDLRNLIYRGPRPYRFVPGPTCITLRIWKPAMWRFSTSRQLSPAQLLWGNPGLHHLHTIQDPQLWALYGIKTIGDVMPMGTLLSFSQLSQRFGLPGWMLFRYFQMRHSVRAQFPQSPTIKTDPIEDMLTPGDLDKPL